MILQNKRRRTTGPGIPLRPSEPGFPGGPWGPTGPVFPWGPSNPDSPCSTSTKTETGRAQIGCVQLMYLLFFQEWGIPREQKSAFVGSITFAPFSPCLPSGPAGPRGPCLKTERWQRLVLLNNLSFLALEKIYAFLQKSPMEIEDRTYSLSWWSWWARLSSGSRGTLICIFVKHKFK